ncbi:TetR/AcrR family transcriptional regulator [uncultured Williamsia sp.]|uniref:TetR/AcrR family transcriptional regulator n=1 Tax=uncultured Williamsia sp. TaxID=259311 RepID=UPI00262D0E13|nr:TetR/AcrR family transcriptional regulator [uncultured Williamsia sp.]
MSSDEAASDAPADVTDGDAPLWKQRTIDRRLSAARARALARSSRFLAAALDLVEESGRADFTVQTLIERSNLSLRAFYQHFAGKEELLLALYEDLTSQFTEDLRQQVSGVEGSMEQLEAFCRGFLSRAQSSEDKGGRMVTIYHLSLEIERPADFWKVWEPQHRLLARIVAACQDEGLIRTDLTAAQITSLLSTTLSGFAQIGVFNLTGPNVPLSVDDMWSWCHQAVTTPSEAAGPRVMPRKTTKPRTAPRTRAKS